MRGVPPCSINTAVRQLLPVHAVQAPLNTWAAGRHTSVVAFGGPCRAPAAAAVATPPRDGAAAAPAQQVTITTHTATSTAALGLLLGLHGNSLLLEAISAGLGAGTPVVLPKPGAAAAAGAAVAGQPLPDQHGDVAPGHVEMGSSAGSSQRPGRLAIWCLELRGSSDRMMGEAGGSRDVGQSHTLDPHQEGWRAGSPPAVRPGGNAGGIGTATGIRHTTGRRVSCRDKSSNKWSVSGTRVERFAGRCDARSRCG